MKQNHQTLHVVMVANTLFGQLNSLKCVISFRWNTWHLIWGFYRNNVEQKSGSEKLD